jgi:hypothetical protein
MGTSLCQLLLSIVLLMNTILQFKHERPNVFISSRTPEGEKNRCAVCGHVCRIEPSCLSPDAPCPSCGNLLWFAGKVSEQSSTPPTTIDPEEERALAKLDARPKRPQNPSPVREPQVQTERLLRRLVRRAKAQWGKPDESIMATLTAIQEPRQVEQLLMLLHSVKSWSQLLASWKTEQHLLLHVLKHPIEIDGSNSLTEHHETG